MAVSMAACAPVRTHFAEDAEDGSPSSSGYQPPGMGCFAGHNRYRLPSPSAQ